MKTTYHNIPALPFAADADVEALRRQLEGGSLEANEDGTVSTKDSKVTKPMYYATGTHAPIVEKDLFEKVQVLLKKRKEQFTKATTQNIYPLSSRIRCSECGSFYRRKVRSGGVKWVCARHEEDFKACNSNYYSEERRRGTHVACGEQPSGHRYS